MTVLTATYLYHEHAKVCETLGESDKALASYKAALEKPLAAIIEAAESGQSGYVEIDSAVIENFSRFCETPEYAGEVRHIRERLRRALEVDAISDPLRQQIGRLLLRFVDCSRGIQDAQNEFEKAISMEKNIHGLRSQAVQDLVVEYIRFLHRLGAKGELGKALRRRLHELSSDFHKVSSSTGRLSGVRRLMRRTMQRLQSTIIRKRNVHKLCAEGDRAYSKGDIDKAFKLHSQAAAQKYPDSIFTIGTYYQLGIGCDVDMKRAREFYLGGAKKGHASSQQHYAALLQMGLGGEADINAAVDWYRRAAAQNHIPALKNLAAVYASGLLGKANYIDSIATYLKAYELGDEQSFDDFIQYLSLPVESF